MGSSSPGEEPPVRFVTDGLNAMIADRKSVSENFSAAAGENRHRFGEIRHRSGNRHYILLWSRMRHARNMLSGSGDALLSAFGATSAQARATCWVPPAPCSVMKPGGMHPRHRLQLMSVRRPADCGQRPVARIHPRRRGKRIRAGTPSRKRHLQGPSSRLSRKRTHGTSRTITAGNTPQCLPVHLTEPFSGIARSYNPGAYKRPLHPLDGS